MKTYSSLVQQELDGARAAVPDMAGEGDRIDAHLVTQLGVQVRRGRQLDDLLMATLHTAVTLIEMDHVAEVVRQNLHLDVAWIDHCLLEIDRRVPERRLGFPAGGFDRLRKRRDIADTTHTPAPATGNCLDEQRKRHAGRNRQQFVDRGRRRRGHQHGQAGFAGRRDGARLIPSQLKHFGAGTDEADARRRACRSQIRILR